MFTGHTKHIGVNICAGLLVIFTSAAHALEPENWTLASTVQRVLQEAPERHVAEAEVKARQGALYQSGVWPNPTLSLGASDALGKEDGQGGIDFNQLSISQALPLSGRLAQQRKQAGARLKQAEAATGQQALALEYEAARVFHTLQLRRAQLQLAKERLQRADEFQHIGQRREQAGDLSRLERLRLDVVRENAEQHIAAAEGEYSEAVSDFNTLLNIDIENPELSLLVEAPRLAPLTVLESQVENHPAIMAADHAVEAARHGVSVARAARFADPEIWLARDQDYLGDRRQNVTAFGVAVTLPLWDRGKGNIDAAQAETLKTQFETVALRRQLGNRVRLNRLHLEHLIEQVETYRIKVLEPTDEIFQLTRRGFAVGEVDILNLVDAVDTYFDARARHLELLQEAWLEAAELRRAAGLSLLTSQDSTFAGAAQ